VFSEVISYREAMHEHLFFSLREALGQRIGAMAGDSGSTQGQIVPDIRAGDAPFIKIIEHPFGPPLETDGATQVLTAAVRPLAMRQIREELAVIGGHYFQAESEADRIVGGTYIAGSAPAVLITSGQHANETSGPVGALRAAKALMKMPDAHFALVPVENVDGYEVHQHLIVGNPLHMHHAARYTARGDDISASRAVPLPEQCARQQGLALSGANLHLNLHGYPSHEWTRPLSGYLPRGFEAWTVPKGFFLILCVQPGWEAIGNKLIEEVAFGLSQNSDLVRRNAAQIACFRAHVPDVPFEVKHGIPCFIAENSFYDAPLTLITEATDETIYDEDFQDAHQAQMDTVLLAVASCRYLIEQYAPELSKLFA
ncbi:MAG: peptidase M14, partial [Alphaproteobacteria bacterium]|nr:peptidase M14 [Alphaproteobacteria bacterium]